jgi:hypothetical protein
MQADPLTQLRDIHLPIEPGWWPPAPGWWLLALLALAAVGFIAQRAIRAHRWRRPLRRAVQLYEEIYSDCRSGKLSPNAYANASNALLKRLLIHGLGVDAARRASDAAWLKMLDEYLGDTGFSEGPGEGLGNRRFKPDAEIDVDGLHALITRFLNQRNLVSGSPRESS